LVFLASDQGRGSCRSNELDPHGMPRKAPAQIERYRNYRIVKSRNSLETVDLSV